MSVAGLNEYESGLVMRALGEGEPLTEDERLLLMKITRIAIRKVEDATQRVEALAEFIDKDGDPELAAEIREQLAIYTEAVATLTNAVAEATRREAE